MLKDYWIGYIATVANGNLMQPKFCAAMSHVRINVNSKLVIMQCT